MTDPLTEKFWEAIPPAWFSTRAQIRRIATEQFNLTVKQFQALRRIRRGLNTVSAIAEDSQTSRPAVSIAVEVLVHKGLVSRLTDPDDRRHIQLSLTEAGARAMDQIYLETNQWLEAKFACLSPLERSQLLAALDLLQGALQGSPK